MLSRVCVGIRTSEARNYVESAIRLALAVTLAGAGLFVSNSGTGRDMLTRRTHRPINCQNVVID
jgi:hypothetical protein